MKSTDFSKTTPREVKRITAKPLGTFTSLGTVYIAPIRREVFALESTISKTQTIFNNIRYEIILNNLAAPFEVIKPIPVVIEKNDNVYVASFLEANVHASGDTLQEAVLNLKSLLADVFDELRELGPDLLGPGPARELAILRTFITKQEYAKQRSRA